MDLEALIRTTRYAEEAGQYQLLSQEDLAREWQKARDLGTQNWLKED